MVRVIDYLERQNEEGESFYVLVLQGGIQMVKSKQTNRFYVTAKRSTISSTFDEATCQTLIGTELPGKIEKVETEPYEYTIKDTGEVIELDYRYEYQEEENKPEREPVEKSNTSIDDIVKMTEKQVFSMNGVE
ncbi:hypothetical protein NE848_09950 [Gramella jeungdoensis]|uniref:DUF4494 domain-containing protein n=1 Tax=Gramella jeungdoensis TaxID=708091 RepID=A0ABT0Z1U1_9FLAO|nr:hypothetical protein [Gramella jeungdoensis]MCM8569703.1 hypothetical protein [Gramella jeungdoensis]